MIKNINAITPEYMKHRIEETEQLKLERDTAIFVAKERLDNIERIQNQKEIFELRYLKADKEIERLKNELTEEKNAYIKMYNMYKENDDEVKRLKELICEIANIFAKGHFEDGCDCYEIEHLIASEIKGNSI